MKLMHRLAPVLATLIATLIAALLGGCVAYVDGGALVRPTPGTRLPSHTEHPDGWRVSEYDIEIDEHCTLYGALFRRPGAQALLVYFGGNQFTISMHHAQVLDVYRSHPVDVLMVDHRGYGASSGTSAVNLLLDDAVRVHDFARTLPGYAAMPMIVHGQSLGSFMAGEVARRRHLGGLVLESSATTAEDWVQGFVDGNPLVRRGVVEGELQGMGNLSLMAELDEPLLVVVGEKDRTTRPALSRALFEAASVAPGQKTLLVVEGAGHNDATLHSSYGLAFAQLLNTAMQVGAAGAAPASTP
jgi:uncharacterized protein